MFVAFIHDTDKYGVILGSYLSPAGAFMERKHTGDLVFENDGEISQDDFWLFDFEKEDPNCYARRMQREKLNIRNYNLNVPFDSKTWR